MKQRDIDFILGLIILGLVITQLTFLVLKLIGVGAIGEWNWFTVLLPTIIPAIIAGMAILLSYIIILSFRK